VVEDLGAPGLDVLGDGTAPGNLGLVDAHASARGDLEDANQRLSRVTARMLPSCSTTVAVGRHVGPSIGRGMGSSAERRGGGSACCWHEARLPERCKAAVGEDEAWRQGQHVTHNSHGSCCDA
jgi:hypothetical protein